MPKREDIEQLPEVIKEIPGAEVILTDLYNALIRDQKEHVEREKEKIRQQYPRLEPVFGLAAPEVASLIEKLKGGWRR